MRVAVAGAGLSGLVAALELSEDGHDVTVYERGDEVGGRVRSTRRDGYVFDRGFQVLFTAYPEARRYLDYDALNPRAYNPGARIASDRGVSTLTDPLRDPKDALGALANRDVTFADKIRVLRLRAELRGKTRDEIFAGDDEDETTREYLRRRGFSSRFVSRFAEPFYGGITLDRSLGTSKRVFEFTFSCLASGKTVVPARGMGEIPKQLAEKAREAGAKTETETRVEGVTAKGGGDGGVVELETDATEVYDAVVVATDPHEAERLTGVGTPDGGKGCTTQYYALESRLEVGKKIVLNADQRDDEPNQVIPVSNVAPEQSPEGTHLVSATWLEARDDADTLAEGTRNALSRWGFDADVEPVQTETVGFAQFGQSPGVHETLPSNDAPEGNVFLAGDYTHDSSINGAMLSGRRAAELVESVL
ncbi:MAG: NAD(P)/FAD-dependent oxidoreductase [Halobacteriales archaeon]|nr:NAD(P)/FAD-dependent oxidoreductase [Halobacteriales archaeon]